MKPAVWFSALPIVAALCVGAFAACSKPPSAAGANALDNSLPLASIELKYVDPDVHARDDFYQHFNGRWLTTAGIPSDRSAWDADAELDEATQTQLKRLIGGLGGKPSAAASKQIALLYAGFMDEARVESSGLKPVENDLARVDALRGASDIPALIAYLNHYNIGAPYRLSIHQEAGDPTRYVADLRQSGLGLPSRDFYLEHDDGLAAIRAKYLSHIEQMQRLAGDGNAAQDAKAILGLETELARIQWTELDNQNPAKVANHYKSADLPGLLSGYDWPGYFKQAGIDGKADTLNISQPSYFTALGKLLQETPLPVWKSYFRWRVLSAAAPYLSKALVDEDFAFYGTTLRGIPENAPRWKRGITLVNDSIGESLGKLYVEQYFPPKNKDAINAQAQVVLAAFRTRIKSLAWMSVDTKKTAQAKLDKLVLKIGFPQQYRDYGKLAIIADDLFGNIKRARAFEYRRTIALLGQPIDRDEWKTLPQTVDAYYDPQLNEVVFPAAILQPPFFDPAADAALNYGGIGTVIARQIAHAFDEQGSHYDAKGILRDWFTGQDRNHLEAGRQALRALYAANERRPALQDDGERELDDGLADNLGLAMAYEAYHLALKGKSPPVIDELTGDQRFYASLARMSRSKDRGDDSRSRSDRPAAAQTRSNLALMNQPGFYAAFDPDPGDRMYLPPAQRVTIW